MAKVDVQKLCDYRELNDLRVISTIPEIRAYRGRHLKFNREFEGHVKLMRLHVTHRGRVMYIYFRETRDYLFRIPASSKSVLPLSPFSLHPLYVFARTRS